MKSFCAALAFTIATATAAHACPPPPPPPMPFVGESPAAYEARLAALRFEEAETYRANLARWQGQWFEQAESVLLARIVRMDTIELDESDMTSPRAHLRPVHWLKGAGPRRTFRLQLEGMTSCGPSGGGDAVNGEVGDLFLVLVREGRPSMRTLITSIALENIVNPDLRALVEQAQVD